MKNIFKPLIIAFAVASVANTFAQQDPIYTFYMYNMSVINPAYTTSDVSTLNSGIIHREQWAGNPGSPKTTNIFGHYAVSETIETGLSFTNDNIGDVIKQNDINVDFAYKLNLGNKYSDAKNVLSFGLKAGYTFYEANYDAIRNELQNPGDPSFENSSSANPNIGAGVFYNTEKFYIGFSVPKILKQQQVEFTNQLNPNVNEVHSYITAGYVFTLSDDLKLKPATMIRNVTGSDLLFDATANVYYRETVELGVAYRSSETISGLINFRVAKNLRLGYAYDYSIGDYKNEYHGGSHEFLLLFDVNFEDKYPWNRCF